MRHGATRFVVPKSDPFELNWAQPSSALLPANRPHFGSPSMQTPHGQTTMTARRPGCDPIISHHPIPTGPTGPTGPTLWRWLLKRLRTWATPKVALQALQALALHLRRSLAALCSHTFARCCSGTFVNIVWVMMGSSKLPRSQASMKARVASSTYLDGQIGEIGHVPFKTWSKTHWG